MSQKNQVTDGPDPVLTRLQVAGLAQHLQRIGVDWLPMPDPSSVQRFAEQFAVAGPDVPPVTDASAGVQNASTGVQSGGASAVSDGETGVEGTPVLADKQPVGNARPTPNRIPPTFALSGDSADGSQAYPGPPLSTGDRDDQLTQMAGRAAVCTRCEILAKCRVKTVFGEGNVNPRVVFFGEAPGREEDLSGRPFVGKAGQLLTKMINACKFQREDVYIMNTVKCRPPNNRNPEPTEVENCREYFESQLGVLRPEYIVCLGLVSAQALLRTKLSVGMMRGKFHRYFDSKVLVTYHPSYLLRTPAAKKAAWEDLQLMLRDAGLL